MRVSRPVAAVVGVATIWPVIYAGVFITLLLTMALGLASDQAAAGGSRPPENLERLFSLLLVGHVGTMIVTTGLLVFYIVHVFKNSALSDNTRILWTIIILMGNVVAMPVYWYLHIWKGTGQ